ncbi:MAG TPA: TetR/AcrR family transcriptional regulator [Nevskiaceae bacterium]|nr:TetR/AcrR family transcriptional regulator [Nevskiaceae bacterium]
MNTARTATKARAARKPATRTHATRQARGDRVEQILKTARDLFGEHGFERTTVADIAAHIGVVEGLVFKYFPTKRKLLLAVLGYWYDGLFGDYTRELEAFAGPRERLHYLIWRHLCTVRDYPRLCGLMFREVLSAEHDYRGSPLHALNRRYTKLLVDTLQAGAVAGEFRTDIPPQLVRSLVYGGIEHQTSSYVASFIRHKSSTADTPRKTPDVDQLADQITSLLCDGLHPHLATAASETNP